MNFEHSTKIPAAKATVWNLLMNVPEVSQCVPGVQDVKSIDGNSYEGTLKVRVGPIGLSLAGTIVLDEQDEAAGKSTMTAQARDSKVGGAITAKLEMRISEISSNEVNLTISTTANMLGKLGEFGQPVIKKKAEQMMAEFTENVKRRVAAS